MKNKNSWDLKKGESVYSQKEINRFMKLIGTKTFLCWCGKKHLSKNYGKKHDN